MPVLPEREPTIAELFNLRGRAALVTGGAGHLGSAMCRALAEAGASVVVTSREADKAQAFADTLPRPFEQSHYGVALDQGDDSSRHRAFAEAVKLSGGLDILINNALTRSSAVHDWTNVSSDEFDEHLRNNTAYFILARLMREHAVSRAAPASIVLIGSMYGVVGSYPEVYRDVSVASVVQYHALKGGTVHLARHLAVYWAADRVRVNCLSPGPFPKPSGIPAEMERRLVEKVPQARMGLPHELKGAILLLTSDAGSYITGQNLLVDGGWTAW